ncbi:hypothetical protein D3C78_1857830 [compost metagenome]
MILEYLRRLVGDLFVFLAIGRGYGEDVTIDVVHGLVSTEMRRAGCHPSLIHSRTSLGYIDSE